MKKFSDYLKESNIEKIKNLLKYFDMQTQYIDDGLQKLSQEKENDDIAKSVKSLWSTISEEEQGTLMNTHKEKLTQILNKK